MVPLGFFIVTFYMILVTQPLHDALALGLGRDVGPLPRYANLSIPLRSAIHWHCLAQVAKTVQFVSAFRKTLKWCSNGQKLVEDSLGGKVCSDSTSKKMIHLDGRKSSCNV